MQIRPNNNNSSSSSNKNKRLDLKEANRNEAKRRHPASANQANEAGNKRARLSLPTLEPGRRQL